MPRFRILTILIVTVILAGVLVTSQLIAEESDRPFVVRSSATFAASNFTKPAPSFAPNPPKLSEQLQTVGNAFSATPIPVTAQNNRQSHQATQQMQRSASPIPTERSGNNVLPSVRQVSATESVQSFGKMADTAEPIKESEVPDTAGVRENTTINHTTGIAMNKGNAETLNEPPLETTDNDIKDEIKNSDKQNHQSADHSSEQLLDKPIGFGETKNDKRLLNRPKIANAITPLISVFGSLSIVIGVFLILVLFLRKVSPKGNRLLPKEAFEDLGRVVLTQKIQLHLLRLGNRLLLVSITSDGVSPITEITDPDEVVPLLGLCRQLDSHSSTEFFRKTLSSFSTGGTSGGYFGTEANQTNLTGNNNRKNSSRNSRSKQTSLVDLYSEPDESLAEILAKGGQHG